jgi:hypothetical protein
MRIIAMPVTSMRSPVGGMSPKSPVWVARTVQRAATSSPIPKMSSMVMWTSGRRSSV